MKWLLLMAITWIIGHRYFHFSVNFNQSIYCAPWQNILINFAPSIYCAPWQNFICSSPLFKKIHLPAGGARALKAPSPGLHGDTPWRLDSGEYWKKESIGHIWPKNQPTNVIYQGIRAARVEQPDPNPTLKGWCEWVRRIGKGFSRVTERASATDLDVRAGSANMKWVPRNRYPPFLIPILLFVRTLSSPCHQEMKTKTPSPLLVKERKKQQRTQWLK